MKERESVLDEFIYALVASARDVLLDYFFQFGAQMNVYGL